MDSVTMYQENDCDSFVSIGGGSAHDACKGARISVAHDGRNVNDFEGFNKSENPKNPPHIAVSTTAGTGSETSWAYVITDTTTDPDQPHKYVAFDDACVATPGHRRPSALLRLPAGLHRAMRLRRARARLRAVRVPAELPDLARQRFACDQADRRKPARGHLERPGSQGSRGHDVRAVHRRAGVQLRRAGDHPLHLARDQRVLRPHHGLNNAIALPRVWAFNMPVAYKRFADIAGAMGVDTHGMTDVQAADAALAAAIRLLRDVITIEKFTDVHPGQLLEEPARQRADEVLRERQGDQG